MCEVDKENDFKPQRLTGVCFQFGNDAQQRHLHAFGCHMHHKKALVFIHGLTEGILSYPWMSLLNNLCEETHMAFIQINMSTSFNQFGTGNLFQDATEIHQLVNFINKEFDISKVVLMGHSTGCQDIMMYLRNHGAQDSRLIKGVFLLGAVSDRECIVDTPSFSDMLKQAQEAVNVEPQRLLSHTLFGAPITAYRLDSFAKRLGDDDMFSTDLQDSELKAIFKSLVFCGGPIFFCYSSSDEFIPCQTAMQAFSTRLIQIIKRINPRVRCQFIDGGHDLNSPQEFSRLAPHLINFVLSIP